MDDFNQILKRAAKRHGGKSALMAKMPSVKGAQALNRVGNDRILAEMSRCVFQAGFVWRIVEHKWPDFETVFFGFQPDRIILLSPEQIDNFCDNPKIIRNRQKILSIQRNAAFILDKSKHSNSFANYIAQWPSDDLVSLFSELKKGGSRLGGMTGQRVLRNLGKDTFVLTPDVSRCLQSAGADIKTQVTSQREHKIIQQCFNDWHKETGLPYSHLSKIAAYSMP